MRKAPIHGGAKQQSENDETALFLSEAPVDNADSLCIQS